MFIVNLKTFLALPNPVLYQKYEDVNTGALEIKTDETIGEKWSDFTVLSTTGESATDLPSSDVLCSTFIRMGAQAKTKGYSECVPLSNEETGRDGLYEDEQLFLVYEKHDIETLIGMLQSCVPAVPPTS